MSAPIKLSFGLKKPLPNLASAQSNSKPKPLSLGGDDDDDSAPVPSTSTLPTAGRTKISTATLSRAQKLKQTQELELDSSVYAYDEVYDNMKEGSRLAELEKKKDAGERKVRLESFVIDQRKLC